MSKKIHTITYRIIKHDGPAVVKGRPVPGTGGVFAVRLLRGMAPLRLCHIDHIPTGIAVGPTVVGIAKAMRLAKAFHDLMPDHVRACADVAKIRSDTPKKLVAWLKRNAMSNAGALTEYDPAT